jgi:hypothetical protein
LNPKKNPTLLISIAYIIKTQQLASKNKTNNFKSFYKTWTFNKNTYNVPPQLFQTFPSIKNKMELPYLFLTSKPLQLTPPLLDYHTNLPLKFLPQHSYYIDGLFKPPKVKENGTIQSKLVGYWIFNLDKNMNISKRFLRLQNILKTELMAIHHIF